MILFIGIVLALVDIAFGWFTTEYMGFWAIIPCLLFGWGTGIAYGSWIMDRNSARYDPEKDHNLQD